MAARKRRGGGHARKDERKKARGIAKPSGKWLTCANLCVLAVLCSMGLLFLVLWAYPSPIQPVAFQYSNKSHPELVGPLAVNDLLKRGQRLFENEVMGPEALVMDKEGRVYTGLGDGRIIRLDKDMGGFTTLLRTGANSGHCGKDRSEATENTCGRPLGMTFNQDNQREMFVVDSSLGLLKVDMETLTVETLVSRADSPVPINFPNDIVQLPNGSLLITDSSLKFSRHDNVLEGLECGGNGQLLVYHPQDGTLHVILRDLHFPNGLSMSTSDNESVLLVETTRARIMRYYFSGNRAGTVEVFVDNLPGWPDNIHHSSSGGYWVGNAIVRSSVTNHLASTLVSVRSLIAKFNLLPWLIAVGLIPQHGLVLELDKDGQVIRSLHDVGGKVTGATSHILELDNSLLIGSYDAPFLLRVEL